MRKYLFAASAIAFLATPAAATNDHAGYVGLEGGVLFPRSQDVFGNVTFTDPTLAPITRTQVVRERYKAGYDLDVVGGYDFGMFRLEGELGYKHAKTKNINFNQAFVTGLNAGAGTTYTTSSTFNLRDRATALSAMVNGLVDFGGNGNFGGYAGGGVGYANVKQFDGSKGRFAWQLIAGVYMPVSSNIDVGLKYRYFNAGRNRRSATYAFAAGAGPCGTAGAPVACSGGTAFFDDSSRFTSHSLLLSLVYNFAPAASPAPPPPPPPPPPPAPAPATQTCPDGSVIAATSTCPAPPPPPPPPAPAQRGERGR